MIGNESTPDLDTGFANWFQDYPHPNAFFQPMLDGDSITPTNTTNLARFDDPKINAEIERLAEEPLGPEQEAEYAALDREAMEAGAAGSPTGPAPCRPSSPARSTSTGSSSTRPSVRT